MEKIKKKYNTLDYIEKIGNKIPHPFILFLLLSLFVILVSSLSSLLGVEVMDPVKNQMIKVKNLLSGEGINFILKTMITNFTGFSPLGLVLVMTLGIGLAEEVGLISTFMRESILKTSPKKVTFIITLIGVCGNIASDAAVVVMPVIAAFIFLSTGRHPFAGIALGYASTTAGLSANILVVGTDAILSGISTEAVKIVNPTKVVSILSNWYFMSISTILLAIIGTLVCEKIIEPRLGKYTGNKIAKKEDVTEEERKALKKSGRNILLYLIFLISIALPKSSFLKNPQTGSFLNSPFLNSIIPFILILFLIGGITYGREIGIIKKSGDIPDLMSKSMKKMSSYIVLVFVISQFIAYFNWSNLGFILAIKGAEWLKNINLSGIPLFITFILLTSFIDLFIGSGLAKWALFAPIFIPMFYMLGYTPELTQLLYRVGDSITNAVSPLSPYFPIILGLFKEYDEEAGVGTVISAMVPYTIWFGISWILLVILWQLLGLPLGPNSVSYL